MLVVDKLTGGCTSGGNAEAVNDVVETAFEALEEDLTGDTAGLGCLVEEIAELLLEHTVGVLSLLLLSEHDAVFRGLATTYVLVASLHALGRVAEDVFAELTRKAYLRTCISCHICFA